MNKADLIDEMTKEKDFQTKAEAERALTAVLNAIRKGLKKDKVVQLIGFGTFEVKSRKARKGVHPRTQQPLTIPKSKTVSFRPGKPLKQMVGK